MAYEYVWPLSASYEYLLLLVLMITSKSQAFAAVRSSINMERKQAISSIIALDELREKVATAAYETSNDQQSYPLWDVALSRRLSSLAAQEGTWIWIAKETLSCVAQVIPDDNIIGRGRINLFHRGCIHRMDELDEIKQQANVHGIIQKILCDAIQVMLQDPNNPVIADADGNADNDGSHLNNRMVLTFGSLDRRLLPYVRTALERGYEQCNFRNRFISQCGMWIHDPQNGNTTYNTGKLTQRGSEPSTCAPSNVLIRSLTQDDAKLVDSRWEYRSDASLLMIKKMIKASEIYGGCVGLVVDNTLVSWLCRYLDGSLGMLWTENMHRKKGYAAMVLMAAVHDVRKRSRESNSSSTCTVDAGERMVSYIVDSNEASQSLYRKLGWIRVADADWAGFASRNTSPSI